MRVEATVIIDRRVDDVFRFQADEHYRNHPRWDPSVTRLTPLGDQEIRLGSRFELTRRMMGREETHTFEVVEWEAPRTFTIATRSPGFSLRITADCAPDGECGTRLTRGARANLDRIKEMVELETSAS